ncbi:hypothetical protein [Microbacterium sp. EST19A]|uniref:hypothetical protein n=1 Tax=Microbacterium sp. EST19A TaxID=2862681 RepID=UPI001CC0009B|nr:hypothetical protein [Microbacterium sp. EST19A]
MTQELVRAQTRCVLIGPDLPLDALPLERVEIGTVGVWAHPDSYSAEGRREVCSPHTTRVEAGIQSLFHREARTEVSG